MINAEDQMRQASLTSEEWYLNAFPKDKLQELASDPVIIAAKSIAAGLDELAMSNRMIAEKINME